MSRLAAPEHADDVLDPVMRKMTAYISQEALRESHKIRNKASEPAIETVRSELTAWGSMDRQESRNVDGHIAETKEQTTAMPLLNEGLRLQLFERRAEMLKIVFMETWELVGKMGRDETEFMALLKGLIFETLNKTSEMNGTTLTEASKEGSKVAKEATIRKVPHFGKVDYSLKGMDSDEEEALYQAACRENYPEEYPDDDAPIGASCGVSYASQMERIDDWRSSAV